MKMRLISCLLLLWTSLADAAQARNIESTKIEDEAPHPIDGMRIINGNNALPGQFPHQMSLRTPEGSHFCGGSIISRRWIVTSARCVVGIALSEIQVVSGTISLASGGTIHQVTEIVVHEDYNPSVSFAYDYAVLRVSPSFTFSPYVNDIKIGSDYTLFGLPIGDGIASGLLCYASGWGITDLDNDALPTILQQTVLLALTDGQCKPKIPGYVDDAHVCTLTPPSNVCSGDFGGPLTCWKDDEWKLYGIASFAFRNCNPELPAGWADTASTKGRKWIRRACNYCFP
ncbi:unnamed protein product [Cyprideis torosa]|uniref:Uncharacterized protein n=1 Tax=Cyprideis torosa TaxID=163714 RepID=A0A7R8WMT8_9CRUS|nr:unnamed protein product [Cyprideis torosa]CAG0899606.1 unnamed protein product [Cyprideis torosa]